MARSLRQIRCGQLSVSFRHWRALQILEARQTVVIRRCLARLQRSKQSSGFRKWNKVVQYLVALEKQQEKLVHRVFGRLCNRSVALAFHFWTTSQNLEKRQERLVLKIFGHLCNRSVSLAFGHWSAATTMMKGMSDGMLITRRILKRMVAYDCREHRSAKINFQKRLDGFAGVSRSVCFAQHDLTPKSLQIQPRTKLGSQDGPCNPRKLPTPPNKYSGHENDIQDAPKLPPAASLCFSRMSKKTRRTSKGGIASESPSKHRGTW